MIQIILGDCIEKLRGLPDNNVDSIITDPPYELGFMGKAWDASGIAYNVELWRECLRVLKPGGHLLAFSGTRTYHRMAVAIEDAGFEVRDMIEWIYGSGFPKSLNIGKAVDKLQGNERDDLGQNETISTSEWEGWGTALKPAHEPICMARKPLAEKTVAGNVLKWGTGGLNIDGCRVETEENLNYGTGKKINVGFKTSPQNNDRPIYDGSGRFPANLIHDNSEEVRACFPETGVSKGGQSGVKKSGLTYSANWDEKENTKGCGFGDLGNASRFFKSIIYQAKASKSERGEGNIHPTVKPIALMEYLIKMVTPKGGTVLDPFMGSGSTGVAAKQNDFKFIGIDITPEYIEIAKARINGVKEQAQTILQF
jgi:site-specific DNA-methyltransferase (adenine-specific)